MTPEEIKNRLSDIQWYLLGVMAAKQDDCPFTEDHITAIYDAVETVDREIDEKKTPKS